MIDAEAGGTSTGKVDLSADVTEIIGRLAGCSSRCHRKLPDICMGS